MADLRDVKPEEREGQFNTKPGRDSAQDGAEPEKSAQCPAGKEDCAFYYGPAYTDGNLGEPSQRDHKAVTWAGPETGADIKVRSKSNHKQAGYEHGDTCRRRKSDRD